MFQFLAGNGSAANLSTTTSQNLKPGEKDNEPVGPILDRSFLAKDQSSTANSSRQSAFVESIFTKAVNERNSCGKDDGIVKQEFKFDCQWEQSSVEKLPLYEAVTKQTSISKAASPVSYQDVTAKIIRTICESPELNPENASALSRDSKTADRIRELIETFVAASISKHTVYEQQEINFMGNVSTSRDSRLCLEKTTLDYYASILPIDLVRTAKKLVYNQSWKFYPSCVAINKNGERCKHKSKLNESTLHVLIKRLKNLPRPRNFSAVIKILLEIVDMLICTNSHLKITRLAISDLCLHFYRDTSPLSRPVELDCLDVWLNSLGRDANAEQDGGELQDHTKLSEPRKLPQMASPSLAAGYTNTSTPEENISNEEKATNAGKYGDLFYFEENLDFEELGFKKGEFTFAPSLTHRTLQPFEWPKRKQNLTAAQLVDQTVNEPVTKSDLNLRGCVYVYGHAKSFGYFKIGRSHYVEGRLEGWGKQCTYLIYQYKDLLQDIDRQAPHPKKLEKLVHAELKNKRCQVLLCEHCGKSHIEWFEVTAKEAQAIVKKWTLWMQTEPYDEHGLLKLNRAQTPTVGDCEFRPKLSAKGSYDSRSRAERRSSDRRRRTAACSERPYPASAHCMETRSRGQVE